MTELIISEKPAAARKIATALADGKPLLKKENSVSYYEVTHGKQDIIVTCAVGHLYGLAEKKKTKGFAYPVFDIEWKPVFEIRRASKFAEKYFNTIKKLAKKADTFTVATDYDVEGEVIGLNIIKYICKQKDARRMKFSTLTKQDLVNAYESAEKHLNWGLARSGETRHFLDYYYGINLSRALTHAIKSAGMFKILSTGRVQAPALNILVEREKEIAAFKPVPFWQISLQGNVKKAGIEAWHKKDKFWEEKEAKQVMKKVKGEKEGVVSDVSKRTFKQTPPTPFDLTTLQTESHRLFGISPKHTLAIAQDLYTAGYISYPRTSSQKLPAVLGLKAIMKAVAKNAEYKELANALLKTKLQPNEGKKSDPAHPAIYSTGEKPRKFADPRFTKIYDLVVRRFMATFGEPAVRETVTGTIEVKKEPFIVKGTRTVEQGWHVYYGKHVKLEEVELPAMKKGDKVSVKKITKLSKETQPPKRYTEASIIKELEKKNLGTKATRANIIDTLYERTYIKGKSIEATELGMKIVDILKKSSPRILDEKLTRSFEESMEKVRTGKKKEAEVLEYARKVVTDILDEFRKKETEIGEDLKETFTHTRQIMSTVGKCPKCKEGTLVIKRGRYGKFIACDKYPDCETTFRIPQNALIEVSDKVCEHCSMPVIKIIKRGKRPQDICINVDCPSKKVETDQVGTTCPKCKQGKMVLRKSLYGAFLACDRFPKCRSIQKIKKE